MHIVERIKTAAAKQGLSLSQLEHCLGFGTRTIYKWDKNSPSIEKVTAVANFLNISLSWLATGNYETTGSQSVINKFELLSDSDKKKIEHFMEISLIHTPESEAEKEDPVPVYSRLPVLGYASSLSESGGIRFMGYSISSLDADFALIADDNSMTPLLSPGESIYVKSCSSLSSGDIGIFYFNRHVICRQYLKDNGQILLKPFNSQFHEDRFPQKVFSAVEITGKVILTQHQQNLLSVFLGSKIE